MTDIKVFDALKLLLVSIMKFKVERVSFKVELKCWRGRSTLVRGAVKRIRV